MSHKVTQIIVNRKMTSLSYIASLNAYGLAVIEALVSIWTEHAIYI